MAQRRLRALGMIARDRRDRPAGPPGHARPTARRSASSARASAWSLGLAAWLALTPAFEQLVGHRYNPLALPWWAVIAGAVLAILCCARRVVVAGPRRRPAPDRRGAVRTPGAAAAGPSLRPARARRWPRPASSAWSSPAARTHLLIVAGIVATTAGMLLLAPLGIRALAALAGRAPVAVRLALRDLVRYQARSGAALAAASLAIGIAATIAVLTAAQQAHDHTLTGGNLPTNQLIVWLDNPNDQGGRGAQMSAVPAGGGTAAAGRTERGGGGQRPLDGRRDRAGLTAAAPSSNSTPPSTSPRRCRPARRRTAAQASLVRPITGPGGEQGWNVGHDAVRGDAGGARPLPDPGRRHRRRHRHHQLARRPERRRARRRVHRRLPAGHRAGRRRCCRTTPPRRTR